MAKTCILLPYFCFILLRGDINMICETDGKWQACYPFPLELSAELLVLLKYLLSFDLDLHRPLPQVNIALGFHWDTFFFVFIIITIFWFIINILSLVCSIWLSRRSWVKYSFKYSFNNNNNDEFLSHPIPHLPSVSLCGLCSWWCWRIDF